MTAGVRLGMAGGRLLVGNGTGSPTTVRAYQELWAQFTTLLDNPGRAFGVYVG